MQASDTSESLSTELVTAAPRIATVTLWTAAAAGGFWASGTLLLAATEGSRLGGGPLEVFSVAFGAFYFSLGLGALAARKTRLPIFGTFLFLSLSLCLLSAVGPPLIYALWARGSLLPTLGCLAFAIGFGAGAGGRLLETLGRELGASVSSWPAARLGLAAGAAALAVRVEGKFFLFRATGWLAAAHALVLCGLIVIHREALPRSARAWLAIGVAVCTVGLLFAANGEEYYRVLQNVYFP